MRIQERKEAVRKIHTLLWDVLVKGEYQFIYDQMPIRVAGMSLKKRVNLMLSGSHLLYRSAHTLNMPLHMQFELTNFCNLHCPQCPTGIGAVTRKKEVMEPELFENLMRQVGPYLLTASLWAWGEPCLHPRLGEMLKIANRYPFTKFISTNGQNLNDDRVIKALIDHQPDYLIVAIDGLIDETNSQFRRGATLENALEGVRKLAELKRKKGLTKPILHMRFIVMKHNEHEVEHLLRFAKQHLFDFLTVRTLSIIDQSSPDETHRPLTPENSSFCAYQYNGGERIEKEDFYCMEPFWFPTAFVDGTIVPCEQDYNAGAAMGKVSRETDFKSIWFGKEAIRMRKSIRDNIQTMSFCRNCPYRDRETTDVSIQAHIINHAVFSQDLT